MNVSLSEVRECLSGYGVRPSAQRMAVMRYLMEHPVHPAAETIHGELVGEMPTLSLATVYNTLRRLVASGAVTVINTGCGHARYDYIRMPHAHACCRVCGRLFDVSVEREPAPPSIDGFTVDTVDVCYYGLCDSCRD